MKAFLILVMNFLSSAGRSEFAVDTHVRRIAERLGWTRPGSTRNDTYDLLNSVVPADIKYALHVQLVEHGRRTCRALSPRCNECVLVASCPSANLREENDAVDDPEVA